MVAAIDFCNTRAAGREDLFKLLEAETPSKRHKAELESSPTIDISLDLDNMKKSVEATCQPGKEDLLIWGLRSKANEMELRSFFAGSWTIVKCTIPLHPTSQKNKGFGILTFLNSEDCKAAKRWFSHLPRSGLFHPLFTNVTNFPIPLDLKVSASIRLLL